MNSRGARTQRRAAERRQRGTTAMTIPDHLRDPAQPERDDQQKGSARGNP